MDAELLQGRWTADVTRWAEVAPDLSKFGPLAILLLGHITVTFDGQTLVISGQNPRDKHYTYTLREPSASDEHTVTIDVERASGAKGVFEITFSDQDHVFMRLVHPKRDVMALKRA